MISAQFEESEDREAAPGGPGQPDSKLGGEHLHEEPLGVDPLRPVYVILRGVSAVLKPPCHLAAPDIEAESDEESRSESHAAHENAGDDVNKRTEEAAVLVLIEEHADPVHLSGRDDEHDDTNKDGKVAVGLTGPVNHELSVLLPPLPCGEQQAVTLEIVLMHRHRDGDTQGENGSYAVTSELRRT